MTLYFFIKTCFNKGAAAATGCLSLLGAVYLPFPPPPHHLRPPTDHEKAVVAFGVETHVRG